MVVVVVVVVVVVSDAIFDDVYGHKASAMQPTVSETSYEIHVPGHLGV